jgi:hypothetical protein
VQARKLVAIPLLLTLNIGTICGQGWQVEKSRRLDGKDIVYVAVFSKQRIGTDFPSVIFRCSGGKTEAVIDAGTRVSNGVPSVRLQFSEKGASVARAYPTNPDKTGFEVIDPDWLLLQLSKSTVLLVAFTPQGRESYAVVRFEVGGLAKQSSACGWKL